MEFIDGLIIIDNWILRKGENIRKKLYWLFNQFEFKLDIQDNLKITDYFDVMFNLYDGTVSPFRKKRTKPVCERTGLNSTGFFFFIVNFVECLVEECFVF